MNERIWDMFKQSGIDIDEDQEGNIEKFAELIVRECAELATAEYNKRGAIHGDDLLTYFGVK